MSGQKKVEKIRGYCSQCSCWCPTVSIVKDGVFVDVQPDLEHPLGFALCPKGTAGPELVYNRQRLQHPLRRTNPKDASDPGWERITWDEALDSVAANLNKIKDEFGAEAIAVGRSGPAGSPMGEVGLWVTRFANALGTPNNIATTHICQWHRDCGSSYTYGNIGRMHSAGRAEFERSKCILVWGSNVHATRHSLVPFVKRGLDNGARLIVIDPRKTEIAAMADIWLQVRPGTDGALALSLINEVLKKNLYDREFVRDWTTAPFLVRSDNGGFLKAGDIDDGGDPLRYALLDAKTNAPTSFVPGTMLEVRPMLDGVCTATLSDGTAVDCKTVFRCLQESVSEYSLEKAASITGIPAKMIAAAAEMFFTTKPACWYSWNGIEQNVNASQTNRAICILYALSGNFDQPGGNVILSGPAVNSVLGHNFISEQSDRSRLGFKQRPLGPAGMTFKSTQAYEVYQSIMTGKPYPIKALIGFGGNLIMSNAPSATAKEAISRLDFHVQTELFLSPTAQLADIVLPAASSWESWHMGAVIGPLGDKAHVQLRPASVPPQHEARSDMEMIFELAKRLGFGDRFWNGDIEAGFNYQFEPSGITVEQLKTCPGGITVDLPMAYQKYARINDQGLFSGFPTPSRRIELYSIPFVQNGQHPLPEWKDPLAFSFPQGNIEAEYPLLVINSKIVEYSHSQHRALPALRQRVPQPYLEINPEQADNLGVQDGDWVELETPYGSITLQAKYSEGIAYDTVCTQNGWWQSCDDLNLGGYDPYSSKGANVNLLYPVDKIDPISGSLPIKGFPCRIKKM